MTNAELEENLPSLKIRSVDQHSAGNYAATFRQGHADEIRETAARLASAQVAVYPCRGAARYRSGNSGGLQRESAAIILQFRSGQGRSGFPRGCKHAVS